MTCSEFHPCGKCDHGWVLVTYVRTGERKLQVCRCVKEYWFQTQQPQKKENRNV
jgi:hypothetical protein